MKQKTAIGDLSLALETKEHSVTKIRFEIAAQSARSRLVLVLFERSRPDGAWKRPFAFAALLVPIPLFVLPGLRSLQLIP